MGGVALHEVSHKTTAVVGSLVEALAGTIGGVPDETLTRLRKKSLQGLLIPRIEGLNESGHQRMDLTRRTTTSRR